MTGEPSIESLDHDHVVADLADRFEMVLEAVEGDEGWATSRVTPGKVIFGNLDGIEAGVRQMIRKVPLEVTAVTLPSGAEVTVPTIEQPKPWRESTTTTRTRTKRATGSPPNWSANSPTPSPPTAPSSTSSPPTGACVSAGATGAPSRTSWEMSPRGW